MDSKMKSALVSGAREYVVNKPETGRISSRREGVHIVKRYTKVGTTMEMEET